MKTKRRKYSSILSTVFVLLLLNSCIEPFTVDVPKNGGFLVVEGQLTDRNESHVIKLTRSVFLGSVSLDAVSGASVFIEDGSGNKTELAEAGKGQYVTDTSTFRGVVGEKYKLRINLNDDSQYESDWVELKDVPEIDSVYYEIEDRETTDRTIRGVQIYADTKDETNQTRYYKWRWSETWSYVVPYPITSRYVGNLQIERIPPEDIGHTCYRNSRSNVINVGTSVQLAEDVIFRHPLVYVSTESNKLTHDYSILVEQFAISEEEFLFLNALQEASNNNGSLYEQQPDPLVGNIRNINNPEEPILGYFSASAVQEKRIFIKGEILRLPFPNPFANCELEAVSLPTSDQPDPALGLQGSGVFFYDFQYTSGGISGYLFVIPACGDCRVHGGKNVRPEFWED